MVILRREDLFREVTVIDERMIKGREDVEWLQPRASKVYVDGFCWHARGS